MIRSRGQSTFGIHVLKVVCLVFCLFYLLDLVPGIRIPGTHQPGVFAASRGVSQFVSFMNACLLAALFYGLQRKLAITWKIGWAFLGTFWAESLIICFTFTLKLNPPDKWISSVAAVFVFTTVAAYWSLWWKRQKNHFLGTTNS
jgi:hypothetical protein